MTVLYYRNIVDSCKINKLNDKVNHKIKNNCPLRSHNRFELLKNLNDTQKDEVVHK